MMAINDSERRLNAVQLITLVTFFEIIILSFLYLTIIY